MNVFDTRKYRICMEAITLMDIAYKKGLLGLENYFQAQSQDENTFPFFQYGLNLICDGASLERLDLFLEYEKMKWIKSENTSQEDLQLITIIERLLLAIHGGNLHLLYDYCRMVLPNHGAEIGQKFLVIEPLLFETLKHLDT